MVNAMKGGGRAPLIPSPAWANFTLMMESTPLLLRVLCGCTLDDLETFPLILIGLAGSQ